MESSKLSSFFAIFLLPLYIKSKIFTIPEFLERRFDSRSRYYFSAISIIGNIFLDAAGALYSAALILKLLFPEVDLWIFVVIFAVIAASYTIPGRPFGGHQHGFDPGGRPAGRLHRDDGDLLCQGRRVLFRLAV